MTDWARPVQLLRMSRFRLEEGRLARVLFLAIPVLAVFEPKGSVILFLVLAGSSLGLHEPRRRLLRFLRTPAAMLLGMLLIWYGISAFWSPDLAEGLWRSLRTLIMSAAGIAVLSLVLSGGEADRVAAERTLVWCGPLFLVLFLGTISACQPPLLGMLRSALPVGISCEEPPLRHAAVQLGGLALPFALVLWHRWGGVASLLFLGLTGAGLALHPKLAAVVAMGAAAAAFAVVYFGRHAGLKLVAALCTVAALLSPQATAFVLERPAIETLTPSLPPSWQHRFAIWEVTAQQISERPFFGYGAGFHRYMRTVEGPPITLYEGGEPQTMPLRFHHPHSTFMQVWLESGAVGALLMAVCFVAFWRMLLHSGLNRVELATVTAAFVGWFVISATDFDPWETRWIAGQWTILVVTAAVVRLRAAGAGPRRRAPRFHAAERPPDAAEIRAVDRSGLGARLAPPHAAVL